MFFQDLTRSINFAIYNFLLLLGIKFLILCSGPLATASAVGLLVSPGFLCPSFCGLDELSCILSTRDKDPLSSPSYHSHHYEPPALETAVLGLDPTPGVLHVRSGHLLQHAK
jgi:hypothetical protein